MNPTSAIYLRVSTASQTTDPQRDELAKVAAARGLDPVIYEDHAVSGAKTSRPAFDQLLQDIRQGRIRTLLVAKLDRLGRSLPHLAQVIAEMDAAGCALVVPSQGIDTTVSNPAARLQLNVLLAVAEFERGIISERTKEGLAAARRRGRRPGRPVRRVDPAGRETLRTRLIEGPVSDRAAAKLLGCSRAVAQRVLDEIREEVAA